MNAFRWYDQNFIIIPEKHPAGSGPYASSGGMRSLRFPPRRVWESTKKLIWETKLNNLGGKEHKDYLMYYQQTLEVHHHHLEFPDQVLVGSMPKTSIWIHNVMVSWNCEKTIMPFVHHSLV